MKKTILHIVFLLTVAPISFAQIGIMPTAIVPGLGTDSLIGVINTGQFFIAQTPCSAVNCNVVALPLGLLEFWGEKETTANHLFWKTEAEENVDYYAIERSQNAQQFDSAGRVVSLNIAVKHKYEFNDEFPPEEKAYYRLKAVDKDHKFIYSNIVLLERPFTGKCLLYPNPAGSVIHIQLNSPYPSYYQLTVTDPAGRVLLRESRTGMRGINQWHLNTNILINGAYVLQIINRNNNSAQSISFEIIHQ
jgi:Secretion system C-terminal sorting domain